MIFTAVGIAILVGNQQNAQSGPFGPINIVIDIDKDRFAEDNDSVKLNLDQLTGPTATGSL